MTRRTILSTVTAALVGTDPLKASASVDLQEIPADASRLYVVTVDASLCMDEYANIQEAWVNLFAPAAAPKLLILDGGARLSIVQPLGAYEIEAAVERGVARALANGQRAR